MKVSWVSVATVSNAQRDANAQIVKTLGLPFHKGAGRLAIVGGGPSINSHLDELKAWDGAIWAVNGTINWCLSHAIEAAFYTIDALPPGKWFYDLSRVKRAVLASDCNPELIRGLLSQGAKVELLPIPDGGPTSAAAADVLSLQAGYTNITWFGCEGSFDEGTHAFASAEIPDWIDVDIGGQRYRTKPEFVGQSTIMAEVIRKFPQAYSERSGGLLRAMVEHGADHDVYQVSNSLYAKMIPKENAIGT